MIGCNRFEYETYSNHINHLDVWYNIGGMTFTKWDFISDRYLDHMPSSGKMYEKHGLWGCNNVIYFRNQSLQHMVRLCLYTRLLEQWRHAQHQHDVM